MMDISSARKYSSDRPSGGGSPRGNQSPYRQNRQSPRIPPVEPTIRALSQERHSEDGLLPPPLPQVHHNRSSDSMSSKSSSTSRRLCAKCGQPMADKFVRAMGKKFHLDCFRCHVCNVTVAAKFFPVEDPDTGAEYALCETDYFRRLDLLCAACGTALRGSYVTALDKKYHVEHFTCSLCDTVFGPQDSYYEHDGQVYCHFHYSTQFAVRCHGCRRAILKQFVEISRNGTAQHWHPECYMIHKYWNVKLASRSNKTSLPNPDSLFNPTQARDAESALEKKINRIWTLLSAFEESSAACISDMLLHVSNGAYIEGSLMAAKFIVHVEVLFGAIDRLDELSIKATGQGLQYQKEAKLLCRKIVNFFSLLSKTYEIGVRRLGITQELLSLVTGLAHYLKILIRLALTASLRLEQDFNDATALNIFLDTLGNLPGHDAPQPDHNINPTSDSCVECHTTIEEACVKLAPPDLPHRCWHSKCLRCSVCRRLLVNEHAMWSESKQKVVCDSCRMRNLQKDLTDLRPGFEKSTLLMQFIFLLRVALARLGSILRDNKALPHTSDDPNLSRYNSEDGHKSPETLQRPLSTIRSRSYVGEEEAASYAKTMDGVRRIRSSHLDQQLMNSAQRARQSRIIDGPEADSAATGTETRNSPTEPGSSTPNERFLSADSLPRRPSSSPSGKRIQIVDEEQISFPVPRALGDERALTLDDLPKILAVEQAREMKERPSHSSRQPSLNSYEFNFMASDPVEDFNVAITENGGDNTIPPPNVKYFSELSALEYFIVRHIAVLALETLLGEIFNLEELLELIETRKGTIWEKFGKAFRSGDKKNMKKKGVFGIPLEVLIERNGSDSVMGSGPGSLRIPAFVDDSISSMRQMDMSVEGVFRKNGNIRRLKELADAFDKQAQAPSLDDENPVQVAALLKKFLRELPDPLLTSKLQRLWIASQKVADPDTRLKVLHLTCCLLPKCNRDTMEVVFSFLFWVATFSHVDEGTGSKMDLHNLATVITPNVLYAKGKDGSPVVDDSFSAIEVIKCLIENTEEFCQVPSDLVDILSDPSLFASSAELTTKDIIKRCGGLFKNVSGQRRPTLPPQDTIRSLNGRQERKTVIRVDTGLAQREAGHNETSARRGNRAGVHTPVSGGSARSGQGFASTESSPRAQHEV